MDRPRIFRCPSCREMINSSMNECRFCSAMIDPVKVAAAAEVQERVGQAAGEASNLRTTAWSLLGLSLLVRFVLAYLVGAASQAPNLPVEVAVLPPLVGFLVLLISALAVLFMLGRWRVKFGSIKADDPHYRRSPTRYKEGEASLSDRDGVARTSICLAAAGFTSDRALVSRDNFTRPSRRTKSGTSDPPRSERTGAVIIGSEAKDTNLDLKRRGFSSSSSIQTISSGAGC
ncbi:MAG: hypothetical protein ACREDR_34120 [Blastocatellia bacterium]